MKPNYDEEFASLRVLVVDDMDTMLQMEVACLKEMGFEHIHTASNGEKAWQHIAHHHVDFVICDWDMPHLNGLQLLKRIREDESRMQIPFIMVTATAEGGLVRQAIADGVTDYLVKPFRPQELGYRVLKVMSKLKATSASEN